jgi:pimeloyl-ACP methyl ester carboxylesterase
MSPSNTIPPLSPYGTFSGDLFQYNSFPSLVAFESSLSPAPSPIVSTTTGTATSAGTAATVPSSGDDNYYISPHKCILIGGLSDGLIPTPYAKDLEKACHSVGWSLVQPLMSSSGLGFGHGSLHRDTQEISCLLRYLIHHRGAETIAFVGHSTGCQNSVHFLKYGDQDLVERVKVVALQAPVSDREHAMLQPNYDTNIAHAKSLVEVGRGEEMMSRDAFWAPITASRFLSLQDFGGDDDFFSSDLSDVELRLRLGHIGKVSKQTGLRVLVAFSGQDEYVPDFVDKKTLLDRLCMAMRSNNNCSTSTSASGSASSSTGQERILPLLLDTGNHNLSNEEGNDKGRFVQHVEAMLGQVLN